MRKKDAIQLIEILKTTYQLFYLPIKKQKQSYVFKTRKSIFYF